jgi:light-regulated signal transduction histidine kinase (bacteriophytochrome)/HPt (histidine-containing phosphotransfer) domain-containing protein
MSSSPLTTVAEPFADISLCEQEPVRVPGAIQPHGAFLVLDVLDLTIRGASANAESVLALSPRELLGQSITRLASTVDAAQLEVLLQALRRERVEDHNPFKISVGERRLNAIALRQGERIIIEWEQDDDAPEFRASYVFNRLLQSLSRLRAAADLPELFARAAHEVRQLTGFDRVIIYAFEPNWSGRVAAEDCVDGVPRYLDLRFPASDIPSQARALYAECRLRMIPTSTYTPAPIVLEAGAEPLDLTHACLRSISPVHLEYMRNMGVTASLGISIMNGEKLWGLITCNHESGERFVPYEARTACGLLGEVVSSLIGQNEATEIAEMRAGYLATQARIMQFIVQDGDVVKGMLQHSPSLLDVTDSSGAVFYYKGEIHALGKTPPRDAVAALLSWLETQDSCTIVIESLPERYAPAHAWKDVACGLVASPISFTDSNVVSKNNWLLWFRPEVLQTVSWGGDPRKQPSPGTTGRLHPRKSFESWQEEVHLKSVPFHARAVAAATSLAADLTAVILEIEASRQITENAGRLAAAHRQRQLVLDATGDGLISVACDGRLLAERSRTFSEWFPARADQPFIWQVLFAFDPQGQKQFEVQWTQLAEDVLPFEVSVAQMCREISRNGRCFELRFKEVREGETLSSILVMLEDVTERTAARREAREAAEAQAIFAWVLRDGRGLGRTLAEFDALSLAARDLASPANARRALHTLKGNAGVLGLLKLADLCHAVEDRLAERDEHGSASATDMVIIDEEISRVRVRAYELAGEGAFERVEVRLGSIVGAIERLEHGCDAEDLLSELRRWTLEPAARQLGVLAARARTLARALGKPVDVAVDDGNVRVDADLFEPLWGALAHAVSNAVDHGLEAESLRLERGKPAVGRITLTAEDDGNGWLTLEVGDDGGGVDMDALRAAALVRGLPGSTRAELLEALFTDQVSTRAEVTTSSGRGVGLAALRETCARLSGTVTLDTTQGLGTTLRVRVPSMQKPGAPSSARSVRPASLGSS